MYPRNAFLAAGAIAAACALLAAPAAAKMPVIDEAAIVKQIESIAQLKSQLDALHQQIAEAEKLYGSLNKLTDMADIASVLNKPEIRRALPPDFAGIESLLKGDGEGALGGMAERFLDENTSYRSEADDFYARELAKVQHRNAGQMSIGQQIYETATKRIDGIDELRKKIGSASDAKEIADLQARIGAESAFLQTDTLRMQGLQMIQQAQKQVEEQRASEEWRKRLEKMKAEFKK